MAQFRVNYAQLQNCIEAEEKARKIIDQNASELFNIMAAVGAVGATMGELGYAGKVWNAYSKATNEKSAVYFLERDLRAIHDLYMQCEKNVLQHADEDISRKNGFTASAVKKADKTSSKYDKNYEKNQQNKKETLGDTIYNSTIKGTVENFKSVRKMMDDFKEWRGTGGSVVVEKFYGMVEKKTNKFCIEVFGQKINPLVGVLRLGEGAVSGYYESWENMVYGVFHMDDPKAVGKGIISYLVLITPSTKGLDGKAKATAKKQAETWGKYLKPYKTAEKVFSISYDTVTSDYYVKRQIENLNKFEESVRKGDVLGANNAIVAGTIEQTKAVADIGVRWVQSVVDKGILKKVSNVVGKPITVDVVNEYIAEQTGVNPGKAFTELNSVLGSVLSDILEQGS